MSRKERLTSLLKKIISDILQTKVQNSKIGFISITEVILSGDMQHAKIFYSVLGSEKDKKNTIQGLKEAKAFIRSQLASRIDIKQVPELNFIVDKSLEQGDYILGKIKELQNDKPNS